MQWFFFNQAFKTKPPPAVWNDTVQEQFYPIVSGSAKADLKAAYNKLLKQYVSALGGKKRKEKQKSVVCFVGKRNLNPELIAQDTEHKTFITYHRCFNPILNAQKYMCAYE